MSAKAFLTHFFLFVRAKIGIFAAKIIRRCTLFMQVREDSDSIVGVLRFWYFRRGLYPYN